MPKLAFSKRRLEELGAPARGRTDYHDTKAPGLCLTVTEKGAKTFSLYRRVDGQPARIKIGRFPETSVEQARKQAVELNAALARGEDPREARRRPEPTLGALFEYWMEHHSKPRKRTWREDVSRWGQFLKRWEARKLASIRPSEVQALHTRVGKANGIYRANRVLEQLRAMYRVAPDIGYTGADPTAGIKKFRETSRDRYLEPHELKPFFDALQAEPNETLRDFLALCLFTGARRGNVLSMRWQDVNLAAGTWRIPDTKAGRPVYLPLTPPALNILHRRHADYGNSPWVLPGRGKRGHITEPKFAWRRICERAGLEDIRIHDLRRSLGSWAAATGASLLMVGKMLGHAEGSKASAVYARLGLDPVRAAADQAIRAMLQAGGVLDRPGDEA